MKHVNSILETFEYFCQISSKSIHVISSYTVSKLGRFETQCRVNESCEKWDRQKQTNITKQSILAGEMYSKTRVGSMLILILVLINSLLTKICAKNDIPIFVHSDLDH